MNERILAIIVCYNPELDALSRALDALLEQHCDLIVVDNGSDNVSGLADLLNGFQRVAFAKQEKNLGLGAAHNIGLQHATLNGYDYALIMDQDSVPMNSMVSRLVEAHKAKSHSRKVSAVGVTYLNADNGSESFFVRFGALKFQRHYCSARDEEGCIEADFLISSGSLIAIENIEELGNMDESLFIDHVDTEWFLRARSRGFKAYGVCDAVMQHGLGEQTHRVSLGGRQRNVPQHKPFRYYYIFRNSVLLYKRRYASGLWKWNDVQRLAMIFIMFGLVKGPKIDNLRMMLMGTWHGLLGTTGPYSVKTKG